MANHLYLGIDTSGYTASVAASPVDLQLHFASRHAAADNAIGLAALARQADCV